MIADDESPQNNAEVPGINAELAHALELAHAERDQLRDLLTRVYREAYNPAAHEKPPVQALWREVGRVTGVFHAQASSRFA